VPLSYPAQELLKKLREESVDDTWVFPSPTAIGPVRSNTKPNARIRKNSGVEFRPHDLRRTAASKMAGELGVDRLTLAKILNHVDTGVTAVYDRHGYDREKREALERWADCLQRIVNGRAT